jgi:large subunit ribosomal protein L25
VTTENSLPIIEIEARSSRGSSASNRYRNQGFIPSIVYHRGEQSLNGLLSYNQFTKIASTATSSQVFALKSKDSHLNGRTCLVKDVQKDFINGKVLHVDLQSLKDDEVISVRIPIHTKGEAYGVKNEGGILSVAVHDLGVRCLPRQIPREIIVDVSELKLNKSIHASDISLPAGVELDDDPHETIVSVVTVRVVEETPATPTAEEAAAAATTAAAPGATPAAAPAADKKEKKK